MVREYEFHGREMARNSSRLFTVTGFYINDADTWVREYTTLNYSVNFITGSQPWRRRLTLTLTQNRINCLILGLSIKENILHRVIYQVHHVYRRLTKKTWIQHESVAYRFTVCTNIRNSELQLKAATNKFN